MLQRRKEKGIVVILSDESLTGDSLEKESYQVLILDKFLNIQLEDKEIWVILSEESPSGDSSETEAELSLPMEETLLPIAKRSLVRYITVKAG